MKTGSNSNLDKEISTLLSEQDINGLKDSMGVVWDRQARLQETISFIQDSATPKQTKYINEMNKMAGELKKSIYDCMQHVEAQKKKLIAIAEIFKKKRLNSETGLQVEDKNFREVVEGILEEKGEVVRINDISEEEEGDMEYHSFEEDREELKHVQNTFFSRAGTKTKLGDEIANEGQQENDNDLTIIKMINEDSLDESSNNENPSDQRYNGEKEKTVGKKQTKAHQKVSEKQKIRKQFDYDLSNIKFKGIVKLITDNPAFVKFPVPDGPERREKMPVYRDPSKTINAWSILKHNVGKDFSRITMPVYVNEPYSLLHRVSEYIHYHECFRSANQTNDPYLRVGYILAGFFILYGHTINRIKKPFNPLLGETFEYIDGDLKLIMEQVSHHPPICSLYAECNDFIFEGFYNMIIKFGYKGFQINPTGDLKLYLKRTKETFSVIRPVSSMHNYIMGKMYIWHSGDLIIKNDMTGDTALMYIKPKGWTSKCDYEAEGKIVDKSGQTHYSLYGRWDSFATAIDIKTQKEINLVTKKPNVPEYEQQYFFSKFSINLNHLTKSMLMKLPPTDTRLRPDQRAYEYGDVTIASDEKHRLEELQRARRKESEIMKVEHKPVWFDVKTENHKIISTKYKGGYWEARDSGNWPANMLDLYDV